MNYIKVMKLDNLNTLVIKDEGDNRFFVTTKNSFIISIPNLSYLLKYLLVTKIISPKLLEAVLDEYYTVEGEI